MNFPEFDNRYWLFIIAIFWVHLFAVIATYHRANLLGINTEANPVIFYAFQSIGIVPTLILTNLIGFGSLIALPFIVKENAKLGQVSVITYTAFIGFVGLDSVHDFLVLIRNPLASTTMQFFNHYFGVAPYLPYAVIIAAAGYCIAIRLRKTNQEKTI